MILKFVSLFISLNLIVLQAQANSLNGLKKSFEEYNYSLTVDWDQKDDVFYQNETKKFISEVSNLRKQGLTNQQIIDFAKSQIKDSRTLFDFETTLSLIKINQLSQDEAIKYLTDSMKSSFHQGASWSEGREVLFVSLLGLVVFVTFFAFARYSSGNNVEEPYTPRPPNTCTNPLNCRWESVYVYSFDYATWTDISKYEDQWVCDWSC